mmetsp:Transcript_57295/g.63991  ORF Transcript_57295/g.63991 Transcript_57295/m.63991 type:complete len:363 (+) Transcript_57295:129-1217(+)|eukprot:CAMPEP_0170784520 /NCGR_PEP_ID=MMETSP0733-20121128/16240_1 /TAXON_ID=186038 /ORGANISM="Fragilariopsis kerguelensis, Strain L26-C5" /LENGTH=362 /DNA_ID=CAMNT_0011129559 /DNA_START=282 /DNA_END=1370 /DNA_ORIENTATION=-
MSTRNLEELMKSQVVSSENTINQALKLNQKIEGLEEKNFSLQDENENLSATNEALLTEREGYIQLIRDLNKELKEVKYLRGELKGLQASWDSLYEEHCATKKSFEELQQEHHNKLKLFELEEEEIESFSSSSSESQQIERIRNKEITICPTITTMTSNNKQKDTAVINQAELLRKVVKKQVVHPSNTVSPMEQKLHELEAENKKMKSTVVRLQTQYREEKYKNEHISESATSTTDSSDSVNEGSSPSPVGVSSVGGLFGFSKRSPQNTPATLSSTPSSTSNNPWGRMSRRNPQNENENIFGSHAAYQQQNNINHNCEQSDDDDDEGDVDGNHSNLSSIVKRHVPGQLKRAQSLAFRKGFGWR